MVSRLTCGEENSQGLPRTRSRRNVKPPTEEFTGLPRAPGMAVPVCGVWHAQLERRPYGWTRDGIRAQAAVDRPSAQTREELERPGQPHAGGSGEQAGPRRRPAETGRGTKIHMRSSGRCQRTLARTGRLRDRAIISVHRPPHIARTAGYLARVGWEVRIAPRGEDDPVKRRNFLAGVTSVTFVPSPQASPFQDPEYVAGLAAQLDNTYQVIGGVPLVSTAVRYVHGVQGVIKSRDNRRLQIAASELVRKASLILFDACRFGDAQKTGEIALSLAQKAEYAEGSAAAFTHLSCLNSGERRNLPLAATYARQGLKLPELGDEQRARLTIRLASALTQSSRTQRASRSMLDQARSFDGLPTNATAMVHGNAGISLARLGRYEEADTFLGKAVQLFSPSPLLQSSYLSSQIIADLSAFEISRAAVRMQALSHIAPLVTSAKLSRKVREILVKSSQWADSPEMRDARDQLRVAVPLPPVGGSPGGATRR
jgi:tetratricopeptide (TPR) repeat protein